MGNEYLHLNQITVFQEVILVALQRGEVTHSVINRYTCWKCNACNKENKRINNSLLSKGNLLYSYTKQRWRSLSTGVI